MSRGLAIIYEKRGFSGMGRAYGNILTKNYFESGVRIKNQGTRIKEERAKNG